MPIVWVKADGSLEIQRIALTYLERERLPGEPTDVAVMRLALRLQSKVPSLVGLTPQLVTEANLPPDRTQRHKWRLQGGRVQVDLTVPDPPDPKKAKKDAIDAAVTLADLKAVLKVII